MTDPAPPGARSWFWRESTLLAASLAGLGLGAVLHLASRAEAGDLAWTATAVLGAVASGAWVLSAVRQRRLGVDLIALVALVGTLATEEYLAGAVITVMLASGRALEARAASRARHDLQALLERAPRVVHRYTDGELTSPDLSEVGPGDLLLVQPGEVVPVDGLVAEPHRRTGRIGAHR